jgi:hypothetical protein
MGSMKRAFMNCVLMEVRDPGAGLSGDVNDTCEHTSIALLRGTLSLAMRSQPVFDGFEAAVEVVLQILQTLANVVSLKDQHPDYGQRQCSDS